MKKHKPVIFVTGPDKGGYTAWIATKIAVFRAGGKAVRMTPSRYPHSSTSAEPDGLIIGGGADIDPGRYEDLITDLKNIRYQKEEKESILQRIGAFLFAPLIMIFRKLLSTSTSTSDTARDHLEWELLEKAVKKSIPVLGICRGAQVINVFFGGTLYQDLANYYKERPRISTVLPRKKIRLEDKSRIYTIFNQKSIVVNSLHNQAVEKTGRSVVVSGAEENGVVQAIEYTEAPFIIGVQWHPEYLPQSKLQMQLFRTLIREAENRSSQ
ncbi:gamma-glutamyl-gamma-aminobutyrate hydrolase family protein [Balneolaceae bacterium ANBcel3]|nr:gamma-glutamyl-gamma-aminobutyrate hydrolase family protein [Balneolaceae bacterium ANBcel3]